MKVKIQVINAFSVEGSGGNPAGVVFDADHFSNEQKQAIATAAGFAETAFVSASKVADYKLDFFTPTKQIPHCGHATIATFSYLKATGNIASETSSKETIDGCRSIIFRDGLAFMEQRAPVFTAVDNQTDEIMFSLGINSNELAEGHLPTIANTGNSFLLVPVKDETVLAGIVYNHEAVYRVSEQHGLIGYYVYTKSGNRSFDATARMFGPYYGIMEEAGTGMAAGPLAAYLFTHSSEFKSDYLIEQGRYMQPASPCLIKVKLEVNEGKIQRLFAGGSSYVSDELWIDVPMTQVLVN